MTTRLCGTCRFFEASSLQTHGWCRNPAFPRRDELALLRKTEIGCRQGWGKDFWAPAADGGAALGPLTSPQVSPGDVRATPVGSGIAPLIPAEVAPPPHLASVLPPLEPAGAATGGAAGGGQDVVVGFDPRLATHPELGDNGIPLPRVRRSAVAEAHRRALERRQAEREALAERRATLGAVASVLPPEAPAALPSSPQVPPPMPPIPPASMERARDDLVVPPAPVPAGPVGTGVSGAPPGDRTGMPTVGQEPPRAPAAGLGGDPSGTELRRFAREPRAPSHAELAARQPDGHRDAREVPGSHGPNEVTPVAGAAPAAPTAPTVPEPSIAAAPPAAEPRYWDQTPPSGRFMRMRPPPSEPPATVAERAAGAESPGRGERPDRPQRPERAESPRAAQPLQAPQPPPSPAVQQVGRPRAEAAAEPTGPPTGQPGRAIRPLGKPRGSDRPAPDGRNTSAERAPQRVEHPPAAPVRPESPPRQVDQQLVQQLEDEWREAMLAAHPGQRCGTCRYYRTGEGGRGACACQFAPTYRQPVPAQELPCLNQLGAWWAASDEGWLEKTEARRPRRATPLLDALERELTAQGVAEAGYPRRNARQA